MIKLSRVLIAASAAALLATGCASGPEFKDVASSIPTIKESQGRIYFYRSNSMFGAAVQPDISLNSQVVGKSKPGGFFYVDEPAGDYVVSTTTETEKTLTFHLDAGETKYVKTSIGLGLLVGRIIPSLESTEEANEHLQGLHYIGTPTTAAAK
ncbi:MULTISPECIES: DUF2846 domain-containing protein [Paraburkholderia]|jgi:hypothetical protein|uniref:DUF2846 domain-containing protein n=1 Tax=Paraburkholderia caribensis TaxID=75105 RepID=A0A9Q6WMZ9_9BURK|nr:MULTISPECIES: DUF2846 domain-containing protein [Paraburkholderia]MCO4876082.1 DUF2846 domain-containing protein [Paraburkholderia caribensis]MDR6381579.1 hypothetical protein [Paraburkholderia caribensis]PTB29459.1 DUF2846 domain-containing protein [Paraburkholderia caribensis]QLB64740.1 hypothetical protein A9O66_20050 [Paraburkholderia caribensis]CAG9216671.1 conserved exported hypothetical protein [Paraburkholderia caribensis]